MPRLPARIYLQTVSSPDHKSLLDLRKNEAPHPAGEGDPAHLRQWIAHTRFSPTMPHIMAFPIRSPYAKVGGIVLVARLIDKVRLNDQGQLPQGYHLGFIPGNRTFDDRFCRFIGISYETFTDAVRLGGSDEEILERCLQAGQRPSEEQIEVWNTFMIKRGWRDSGTPSFLRSRQEAGLSHREDLVTFFDLMDAEEGHPPHTT